MSKVSYAQHQVGSFIMKETGINFLEFPDSATVSDWIDEDMSEHDIDEIIPDLAWEILDNSGMERDLVNSVCYPEEYGGSDE